MQLFAHDTEASLAVATELVNTEDDGALDTVTELETFMASRSWLSSRGRTQADLAAVRALRPRLRSVWQAAVDGRTDRAVETVNALLREGHAMPRLVRHDQWGYHLHASESEAPAADRLAVVSAMGVADVIRAGELVRLRVCGAADCRHVFVDLSKNRSRRYCDRGCGNRTNVAAHRARTRARAAMT